MSLPRNGSVGSAQHFRTNWAPSLEPNTVQAHVSRSECCSFISLEAHSTCNTFEAESLDLSALRLAIVVQIHM